MTLRQSFPTSLWILLLGCLTTSCTTTPPPHVVYRDPLTEILLQYDPKATEGHSHPIQVSPELVSRVLGGIKIQARKGLMTSFITGQAETAPAFSKWEIAALAPLLSKALDQATPEEVVTFYRRVTDSTIGLGITSGGLFVQNGHLYFILANNRTLPSESMRTGMTSDVDPATSPLLPLNRAGFSVTFVPETVLVPEGKRNTWPYVDPGRIVVIDLARLPTNEN